MDRVYIVGGHCFSFLGERLMKAVDGISGFRPFVWQPDTVLKEEAGTSEFTVVEGNDLDFPAFKRKSYEFGYEDVTGTFGVGEDGFWLELAPQGESSLSLRTVKETGKGLWLYGN